jgi:hypothetical protein
MSLSLAKTHIKGALPSQAATFQPAGVVVLFNRYFQRLSVLVKLGEEENVGDRRGSSLLPNQLGLKTFIPKGTNTSKIPLSKT